MNNHALKPLYIALIALSAPLAQAEDISQLFNDGKLILDARYRYEHVDQDNALSNANAQTLRTRRDPASPKAAGPPESPAPESPAPESPAPESPHLGPRRRPPP